MVWWVENGSLEKNAGLEDQEGESGQLCVFYNQLFFKKGHGGGLAGEGGQGRWREQKGKEEKWGREFLIQTIPWFSARSNVWEFCGALGRGLRKI